MHDPLSNDNVGSNLPNQSIMELKQPRNMLSIKQLNHCSAFIGSEVQSLSEERYD